MSETVTVFEMAPRDGLQNEARPISTAEKIRLVDMLTDAGLSKIETASFVSPRWVPQMADGAEVMAGIRRGTAVYTALTPNQKGYERSRAAGADEVAVFASASEGFSQKNINCSIAESIERFRPILSAARADGVPVRGYVSCAVACPYDGPTPRDAVARVTDSLLEIGCYEAVLSDTIGAGTPETVVPMIDAALTVADASRIACHYHDTGGQALDNIRASLPLGIRTFDAAAGGLGGCPYAPGAKGNVATEAVVDLLETDGFATGIDRTLLAEAAIYARSLRTGP